MSRGVQLLILICSLAVIAGIVIGFTLGGSGKTPGGWASADIEAYLTEAKLSIINTQNSLLYSSSASPSAFSLDPLKIDLTSIATAGGPPTVSTPAMNISGGGGGGCGGF